MARSSAAASRSRVLVLLLVGVALALAHGAVVHTLTDGAPLSCTPLGAAAPRYAGRDRRAAPWSA